MDVVEFYFAFHAPATWADLRSGSKDGLDLWGHVEAFGYTVDQTWFFFDPGRHRTSLHITHLYDEVQDIMAAKFNTADEVIRYKPGPQTFRAPVHGPMNCATQCAGLVGMRAFTPKGFRRKLLRNNAEVIHETEVRSRSGS